MTAVSDSLPFFPTPHLQIPAELYFQVEREAAQVYHLTGIRLNGNNYFYFVIYVISIIR